jgi:CRP-like cAMP-binding protein
MPAPAYFGEIGGLEQMPRTATVIAIGTCRCLRIDGEALREVLIGSPPSSGLMENAAGGSP